MNKSIIISEGYSQVYLPYGIILFAVSIPFLIFIWKIGICISIIAIILFFFKTGLELDVINKRCRGFKEIFGIRFGRWIDLKDFSEVIMDFTHEYDKDYLYRITEAGSMFQATSFEIFARNENRKVFLYEFVKYNITMEALNAFRESMNFIVHDEFEVFKKKVKQRYREFNSQF